MENYDKNDRMKDCGFDCTANDPQSPRGAEDGNEGRRRQWEQEYDSLPLEGKLAANLREMAHLARHGGGGKGGQGRILAILARRGQMTQRELMEIVDVRSGSLSEVLGKLETAGYITRRPNEADHRSADILLTQEGREAAETVIAQRAERRAGQFACLNEGEKAQFNALLEKLNADWRTRLRAADDGRGCCEKRRGAHGEEGRGGHGHCGGHGGHKGRDGRRHGDMGR